MDNIEYFLNRTFLGNILTFWTIFGFISLIFSITASLASIKCRIWNARNIMLASVIGVVPFALQSLGALFIFAKLFHDSRNGLVHNFEMEFERGISIMSAGLMYSAAYYVIVTAKFLYFMIRKGFQANLS